MSTPDQSNGPRNRKKAAKGKLDLTDDGTRSKERTKKPSKGNGKNLPNAKQRPKSRKSDNSDAERTGNQSPAGKERTSNGKAVPKNRPNGKKAQDRKTPSRNEHNGSDEDTKQKKGSDEDRKRKKGSDEECKKESEKKKNKARRKKD